MGRIKHTGREKQESQIMRNRLTALSPHASIITLNVNGLNSPIKRHRVAKWIKVQDPTICCLQETHLSSKDKHRLRVKEWRTILQANSKGRKSRCCNSYIRQSGFQNKTGKERHRGTIYNDQRDTSSRRNNAYKYLCTQHRSTKVHKATINRPKGRC
uniref:exodeoxyribonuclease III n=1 Tax=Equus caballus TaxID=9796 RepID=A0A9L0RFN0_HORSE